jgi:hypothetical protein
MSEVLLNVPLTSALLPSASGITGLLTSWPPRRFGVRGHAFAIFWGYNPVKWMGLCKVTPVILHGTRGCIFSVLDFARDARVLGV